MEALASQNHYNWCVLKTDLFENINHGEGWVIPVLWKALLPTCPTLPCPAAALQPLTTLLPPIFVSSLPDVGHRAVSHAGSVGV